MPPFRVPTIPQTALFTAVIVGGSLTLASTGCLKLKRGGDAANAAPKIAVAPVKRGPTAPKIDYAAVRPNELGRIPVIMYHEITPDSAKKPKPLSRSVSAFKKDLELLYAAGFIPVNMGDVVNDRIAVPAGKSPVVLTFDDARPSQFQLVETPQALQIAPDCAMGILQAFHKEHADWPMKATFFILPKSKATLEPFGQLGMGTNKLQYIVDNGMEIGNHTTLHKSLRNMTPAQIQQEIGNANNEILEAVPKATIDVMAVPMGQFPHNKANWQYLRKGTYGGKPYEFKAVLDAAWRPIPSPASKEWNAARLERIDAIDGLNGIRDWITKLTSTGGVYQRYVSDGDPNVISFPKGNESLIAMDRVKGEDKLLNPYSPFGGPGGAKPIISADAAPSPAATNTAVAAKPIVTETTTPASAPVPATSADPAPATKPITNGG